MSNPNNSNNKTDSSLTSLNLPALTKQLSNHLSELDRLSNNSHKQFQEHISISENLSKTLSKLNSIVFNSNKGLEDISNIQQELSSLKNTISKDINQLQEIATKAEDKITLLTNLHTELSIFLRNEENRFRISQRDFTDLSSTITRISKSLDDLAHDLKLVIEENKVTFVNKLDAIEQKLTNYTNNFQSLSLEFQNAKKLANQNTKIMRGDTLIALIILGLFLIFFVYSDYYYTKNFTQINSSLYDINQQIQSLKPTPTPEPTSTPEANNSGKPDKKRSK